MASLHDPKFNKQGRIVRADGTVLKAFHVYQGRGAGFKLERLYAIDPTEAFTKSSFPSDKIIRIVPAPSIDALC